MRGERGFTLVELLVALFISVVIGVATIGFMTYSQKSHAVQEQVVDAQQNVRVATDQMVRDIRMAGYPARQLKDVGFKPFETTETASFYANNKLYTVRLNNAAAGDADQLAGTDAVVIWRGDSGSDAITCYPSGGGGAAAATIRVRNNNCPQTKLKEGDILLLIPPGGGAFTTVQITNLNPCQPCAGAEAQGCFNVGMCDFANISPGLSGINSPGGLGEDYTGGSSVKFRRLVYFVEPDPQDPQRGNLRVCDNCPSAAPAGGGGGGAAGGNLVTLATNVEDLQVAYRLNNGTIIGDDAGEGPAGIADVWNVRNVRLSLLTRTAFQDPLFGGRRQAIENRLAGAVEDPAPTGMGAYRRRLLQEEIRVRNLLD
jgi:prepilin-type N-terminal cleavage/methylation domain-containing protein